MREQESTELQKQQEILAQQRRLREQAERARKKKLEADPEYSLNRKKRRF